MVDKAAEAEVLIVVRVRLAGVIKDIEEAKVMAQEVVESAQSWSGTTGTGGKPGFEVEEVKGLAVTFANLS